MNIRRIAKTVAIGPNSYGGHNSCAGEDDILNLLIQIDCGYEDSTIMKFSHDVTNPKDKVCYGLGGVIYGSCICTAPWY